MNLEPKYENYTLTDLRQALNTIDRDLYPERVERIKEFISKKEEEKHIEDASLENKEKRKLTLSEKRLYAFAIDFLFVYLLIDTFFNLVPIPINNLTQEIINFSIFVLYFMYYEKVSGNGTVGKDLLKIQVFDLSGGKYKQKAGRYLILGFVLFFDFSVLTKILSLPFIVDTAISGLKLSYLVSLVWNLISSKGTQTIHDKLSRTFVGTAETNLSEKESVSVNLMHLFVPILPAVLLVFGFYSQILNYELFQKYPSSINESIEQIVSDEFNINSQISINEAYVWHYKNGETTKAKELRIAVTLPMISWVNEDIKALKSTILKNISIPKNSGLKGGEIKVEFSFLYFFSGKNTSTLTF